MRWSSAVAMALAGSAVVAAGCSSTDVDDGDRPVVEVFAPYRGAEADAVARALGDAPELDGIDVRYIGSADFVIDLRNRVVGDDRPDVAIVPQPGLVASLDEQGVLVAHGPRTRSRIADDTVVDLVPGRGDVAVPYRTTIKSLVWFRPDLFETFGWQPPATLDQLDLLVEEIATSPEAEGIAPWCFSISSGRATGWPGTDWVEDVVLRLHGAEVYDQWRDGDLAFGDPRIRASFEFVEELVLGQGLVAGGTRALAQTDVIDTSRPLFAEPAGCAMYKQASFALDWFPAGTQIGPDGDVDVFVVPGLDDEPAPLVIGGDSVVVFDDRPEVDAVAAVLASTDAGAVSPGYLTGGADAEGVAPDQLLGLLDDDRVVRVDASDTMPPDFGSGAFWSGVTDWMTGTEPLDSVLAMLDAARDDTAG